MAALGDGDAPISYIVRSIKTPLDRSTLKWFVIFVLNQRTNKELCRLCSTTISLQSRRVTTNYAGIESSDGRYCLIDLLAN